MRYVYEFLDGKGHGTGETVEAEQPFGADALKKIDKRPVRRVPQGGVGVLVKPGFEGFRSSQLADWEPHAKHHDKNGRPVFKRKADLDRCIDKVNNDPTSPMTLTR